MANILPGAAAPSRRIDAGVYEARLEAERVLAEARAAARQLSAAAEADAAAIRASARAEGRSEGLADAAEMLVWAAGERDRLIAAVEPEVARLALGIAAKILGREAELGPALVQEVAARALSDARERTLVTLRVHPLDLPAVREREAVLSALVPRVSGIAWVSDASVGRGGVVVETETGSIDAQLEVVSRIFAGVRS
jgi:type III secretion protein L